MPQASLKKFAFADHNQLADCAATSPRIAQLAVSHPLLFFALATGYGSLTQRLEAVRLCEIGRSLKEVSAAAGIPFTLRRLPAESLARPLTLARITEASGRIIAQRCALRADIAQRIVRAAFYGARIGGEEFGLWLSRPENVMRLPARDIERVRAMALYAWFSSRPEQPLSELVDRRWSPNFSWTTMLIQTRTWVSLLKFFVYFHSLPIEDRWADGARVDGFDIVPLVTFEQLMEEIRHMQNCLTGYADRLIDDRCRLYGVRQGRTRIGTVEVTPTSGGMLQLSQFCGPGNSRVPLRARAAVADWLAALPPVDGRRLEASDAPLRRERLEAVLTGYHGACGLGRDFWRRPLTLTSLEHELMASADPDCVDVERRPSRRPDRVIICRIR